MGVARASWAAQRPAKSHQIRNQQRHDEDMNQAGCSYGTRALSTCYLTFPLHAVIGSYRKGLCWRIDAEVRPWAGKPRVSLDNGFVDVHAEAGLAGDDQVAVIELERLLEDHFSQRERIHARS